MDAKTNGVAPRKNENIVLHYQGHKLSIKEAARAYGISAGSIKWRWYKRKEGKNPLYAGLDDEHIIFGFYGKYKTDMPEPPDDKAKTSCVGAGLLLSNGHTLGQVVNIAGHDAAYPLLAKESWNSNQAKKASISHLIDLCLPGKRLGKAEVYALMAPLPGPAAQATIDALLPGGACADT